MIRCTVEVEQPSGELVDYAVTALPDLGEGPRWLVTSPAGTGYTVRIDRAGTWRCTCGDFQNRFRSVRHRSFGQPCKHIDGVRDALAPLPRTALAHLPQRSPMDAVPTEVSDPPVPAVPDAPGDHGPGPGAAGEGPAAAVCEVQPGAPPADVPAPAAVRPAVCPFCLSEDVVTRSDRDWDSYVTCLGCGAIGPSGKDEAGAVARWNARQAG